MWDNCVSDVLPLAGKIKGERLKLVVKWKSILNMANIKALASLSRQYVLELVISEPFIVRWRSLKTHYGSLPRII